MMWFHLLLLLDYNIVISIELYREHKAEYGMTDAAGNAVRSLTGVGAEEFHHWVSALVTKVDPKFRTGANFTGRGKNVRAIAAALAKWADPMEAIPTVPTERPTPLVYLDGLVARPQ